MALNHFPHVYEPIDVGRMHLKNRIQYSPIVSNHCGYFDGKVTEGFVQFMRGQARTGCGLITIGSTPVNFDEGRDFFHCMSVRDDHDIAGLTEAAREVHRMKCCLSVELTHAGMWAMPVLEGTGMKAFTPCLVPELIGPQDAYHVVTREDMDNVIRDHAEAVRRCREAGFDMAMIHLAHGNLLSSFISPFYNRRTDEYGGSAKNRWKFPLEVLEAAREAAGDMPLEIRFQGNEWIEGGAPLEERIEFLKEAEQFIDMVCVSGGMLYYPLPQSVNMPGYFIPHGINVDCAAAFKEACPDLVVSVVGGISSLEHAEEIISSGKADMVAMAKALMADKEFVAKGARGEEEDIAPCLRCLYCIRYGQPPSHLQGCVQNPELGWEFRGPMVPTATPDKKIAIVGGGPAGYMAAKTLKERGFTDVTIYEARDELGGRVPEAAALSYKDGFRKYHKYINDQVKKFGTKVELNCKMTADKLKEINPDVLLIATGAVVVKPKSIAGINDIPEVGEVDRGNVELGKKVIVCGAGLSGSECALKLTEDGHEVTLIDQLPLDQFYKDFPNWNRAMMDTKLEEANVVQIGELTVCEVSSTKVVAKDADGKTVELEADSVVNALGVRPGTETVEELSDIVPQTYVIGDAWRTGMIGRATNDAYWVCREL